MPDAPTSGHSPGREAQQCIAASRPGEGSNIPKSIASQATFVSQATFAGMLEQRFRKTDLGQLTRREASTLLSELTGANGHGPHA